MRLRTALLIGAAAIMHTSAWAQGLSDPRLDTPTVRVGLFTLRSDGQIGGSATKTADRVGGDLTGMVWIAPCTSVGASSADRPIAAAATDVWKLSGTVLELGPEQATVQVSWQRVRKNGQDEQATPQQATLTLKRGERTTLEPISKPARGSCEGLSASFDATLVSTREMFPRALGGGVGSSGSAGATVSRSSSGGGGVVIGQVSKAGGRPWPPKIHADLWLVRTSPGRPDETLHITSQVMPGPLPFAFVPLTIQTASGTFTVKVQGSVESGFAPTGEPHFYFSANRTTSFAPTTRASRDTAPTVEGSTKTSVPMPGDDEVLSFDMPPLRIPGGATVPDKLSVRVKLTREGTQDAKPR